MLPRASIKELELAIARRAVCKTIKIIKMEKLEHYSYQFVSLFQLESQRRPLAED